MQDELDQSDVHHAQALGLRVQMTAHRHLREGKARVAPLPTEARIARRLTGRTAAKEGFDGQIDAYRDVLQDLRLDPRECGPLGLECGQAYGLIVVAQRLLPLLPRIAPLGQQVIVQPATFLKLLFEKALLLPV
jgi:hypothetical protein